jgi:hypothetical protein
LKSLKAVEINRLGDLRDWKKSGPERVGVPDGRRDGHKG